MCRSGPSRPVSSFSLPVGRRAQVLPFPEESTGKCRPAAERLIRPLDHQDLQPSISDGEDGEVDSEAEQEMVTCSSRPAAYLNVRLT